MKGSDVVAIAAFAISLTALLGNVAVMWLKWPRIVVEVTNSRDTVLRHGGPRRGGRGIHRGGNSPFHEAGRGSHDG
jgi:hypothetical protein